MTKTAIKEKVLEILEGYPTADGTVVTEMSNLTDDLGFDSLDLVELVIEAETEFNIDNIDDDVADLFKTGNDLINYIAKVKGVTDE